MSTFRALRTTAFVLMTLGVATAAPARAGYPVAPDVAVFCEPTLLHAVTDVAAAWRAQTGVPVHIFTSPTWALLQQVAHHARDDVIIGEGDAEATSAVETKTIKPETLQRLWRNQLVVASDRKNIANASAGSATATDNLAALAGKAPIAIVDPWAATAGADSEKALQSLGLWQAVSGKYDGVVGTADAAYLLAQGRVELAVVYATDVAANPGFRITDRLQTGNYPPIVYWVALPEYSLSPNAAKFIAFLHQAQAQQRVRADGLEVLP